MNALYTKACELEFPVNMGANNVIIVLPSQIPAKILKWKVSEGNLLSVGRVILLYDSNFGDGNSEPKKFKASQVGTVVKLLAAEGDIIKPGEPLLELEKCCHPTVMKDMCAECGADLRMDSFEFQHASVPMVHSVPELKVSLERAQILGKADEVRLLKQRKLVLLVDLDQTLIHTTNDDVNPNLKDIHHFQLHGPGSPWYHTRLRPGTHQFLEHMSHLYELHICTFGSRTYAHAIAAILDHSKKFFSHRILSRDECFNPYTKTANLKALFPCGDNLVCIIDDREDVWNYAPNLVHVRPYHFFQHTGDINAPPPPLGNCEVPMSENAPASENVGKTDSSEPEKEDCKKDVEEEVKSGITNSDNSSDITESTKNQDVDINLNENIPKSEESEEDKGESVEKDSHFKDEGGGEETKKEPLSENDVQDPSKEDEDAVKGDSETDKTEKLEQESNKDGKEEDIDSMLELEDHDDYLLHLEDILTTIHGAFYQIYDQMHPEVPDLKNVVPYVRRKVLQGVRICFSGVVPIGVPLEASRVYAVAKGLGAEVTNELVLEGESCNALSSKDEPVYNNDSNDKSSKSSSAMNTSETTKAKLPATHLVAARLGTYKVNQAKRVKGSNLKVVTPDWLWCCAERWERVDERLFPLNKTTSVDCIKRLKNVFGEMPRLRDSEFPFAQEQGTSLQNTKSEAKSNQTDDSKTVQVSAFATYDPVTGKRVIKSSAGLTGDTSNSKVTEAVVEERQRTPSGRFMDTINPLLSFSSEEIANMEDEVEEGLFDDEEDETESEVEGVRQEEALDVDSRQSDVGEETKDNQRLQAGAISRKRKSSSIYNEDTQMEGEEIPKSITKHFSEEGQLKDLDYDDSIDMEDAEEDEFDDKDWSMMGAALERGIMTEEIE
ncbi:hypothetical protein J437_LFUL000398 [Ladona fulva]|uniref:RNA polymerase II subunit A C-terminal domain phosphatase n=1 Tax=Ladona fulva TaxID=123851 RepID=A0A8K0NWT1_LADFU|nr:hypothetical protein J437_LFUL000398 [Ladona fulva]